MGSSLSLVDELVVDQFQHREAILGVLVQAAQHEILSLVGQWHSLREVNVLIDYLAQIVL